VREWDADALVAPDPRSIGSPQPLLASNHLLLGDDYADADDDPADDDGGLRAKPIPDPSADHSDCSNDGGVDDPAAGYHFPHDPSAANPS